MHVDLVAHLMFSFGVRVKFVFMLGLEAWKGSGAIMVSGSFGGNNDVIACPSPVDAYIAATFKLLAQKW